MTEPSTPTDSALEILAFSPHPDDVEIGCAGALLIAARRGARVGIVDLTDGERASRGSVETRRLERDEASRRLGVTTRSGLGLADTSIAVDDASTRKVVEVVRALRPRIVLAPFAEDRHPDHEAGAALVRRAVFLAGVQNVFDGPAHRVGALVHYMIHGPFTPSFIVDISAVWDARCDVLAAYESQFGGHDRAPHERSTDLSHPSFAKALEARASHYGAMIGVARGEPYWQRGPLSLGALSDLETPGPSAGYRMFP